MIVAIITFYIGYSLLIKKTYSTGESILLEQISNNIVSLNSILKNEKDVYNPFYLDSIVDENGNVPAYEYYSNNTKIPSRSIKELKAYDNKIFMGVGDWNDNTGPVNIVYYDTLTGKIETSGTIADEAVQSFVVIDDKLYTTGTDPRDNWGYGSYYVYDKDNNKWNQHRFNDGWIHVFDIEEYNDKIFMCGSTVDTMKKSAIQVSFDNGETFVDVKTSKDGVQLPYHSSLRFYAFEKYNNELYARLYFTEYDGKYIGIYKYNEENNEFVYVHRNLTYEKPVYGLGQSINYNFIYLTNNTIFNDNFIFVSGNHIYKSTDFINFEKIITNSTDVIQDVVLVDDVLYTLSYQYNEDKSFSTRIYSTKDLETFNLIYEFIIDTIPFSIEHHNNILYIGTAYNNASKDYQEYNSGIKDSSETGSLYKIELGKMEQKLVLDEKNKVIKITKDGITYPAKYDLSTNNIVFKTTLSFDINMSEKEWKQEFSKFQNLNLLYALTDNRKQLDYDFSLAYYNEIVNNKIDINSQNYDNAIEFSKSIFSNDLNIENERFNITTQKVNEIENEYSVEVILTVYDINENITSDEYIVNENEKYIYIGTETNSDIIKNNLNHSDVVNVEVDLDNNILLVKYNDYLLKEYSIISFSTDKKIINKTIYVGNLTDEEVLDTITTLNLDKRIENNKLILEKSNSTLEEYNLIRIFSEKFTIVDEEKIYVGNKKIEEIKENLEVINAEFLVSDKEIEIIKDNISIVKLEILNLNFKDIKMSDKVIIIPEKYLFDELINDAELSTDIGLKVFENNKEITSGYIEKNMILKIFYNEKQIDEFKIITEYLIFDSSINVDEENKCLSNIRHNITVSSLLTQIDTTGNVMILSANNKILNADDVIGTGNKIKVELIKKTMEYQFIITGDTDGNGQLNLDDIFSIANYIYNDKTILTGVYLKAADYDNNQIYDLTDIMKSAKTIYKGGN